MNDSQVLVIGGTGPTGVPLVNEFLQGGFHVSIMHSGRHPASFDAAVEVITGDVRDEDEVRDGVGSRSWEIVVASYGRLRMQAKVLAGKTHRFVGITGQPVYIGAVRPTPRGAIALPVPEFAERQYDVSDYTGKVAAGEDQLFEQHGRGDFEVAIVRYPGVFGPRAPINHEWAVVKRILDRRPFMLMPHDGMAYFQRGYVENLAHLVFLAATRPEGAGEAFNGGDERVLSARRVAELIVDELGSGMELVGVPAQYCRGVYPLAEKSNLILDMSKARNLLGYRDRVEVESATRFTARWLRDNPPNEADLQRGGTGIFDYPREEKILGAWHKASAELDDALTDP